MGIDISRGDIRYGASAFSFFSCCLPLNVQPAPGLRLGVELGLTFVHVRLSCGDKNWSRVELEADIMKLYSIAILIETWIAESEIDDPRSRHDVSSEAEAAAPK